MAMVDVNATLPMQGGGKYNILRGNDEVAIAQELHVAASTTSVIAKNVRKVYVTTTGGPFDIDIPAAASMPHQVIEFICVVTDGSAFTVTSVDAQDVTTGRDLDAAGDWIRIQSVDGLWVVLAYNQA
jgi:hypothetical protein